MPDNTYYLGEQNYKGEKEGKGIKELADGT
jgi:hypothetical protein